jgi:hypothetical protein
LSVRILLDECLPRDLARELIGHEVKTVPAAGWAGISNGRLIRLIAASGKFDLFVTVDKRLPVENRATGLPFAIVVLRAKSNRMIHILAFATEIRRRLAGFRPGNVYVLTSLS